ncbi:MAG TPA: LuxR C-terminal-related transcriptional regulator [Streptosporangiaceae bacterium]
MAEDFVGGVQPGGVGIAKSGHAWTLSHAAHLAGRGQPLRIIVADDQASVREGLVLLLGGLPDIDVVRAAGPPDGLTQREAEILGLIARGLTNPEIAARLFLSNHTIKTHISRIFAKTGSRDRAAAIGYAHHHHIG